MKMKCSVLDKLIGDQCVFHDTYETLYGKHNHQTQIEKMRKNTKRKYVLVGVIFAALFLAVCLQQHFSQSEQIINSNISKNIPRPVEQGSVLKIPTKVKIETKEDNIVKNYNLLIRSEEVENKEITQEDLPVDQKMNPLEKSTVEVDKIVMQLNKSTDLSVVTLPTRLEDGTKLTWQQSQNNRLPALLLSLFCAFVYIYMNRFSALKKQKREAKESILRELPEFINKLILLLNAGLVMTTAFSKIMEDFNRVEYKKESYFYIQLNEIYRSMEVANASLTYGLREFAVRSNLREFMRLSNIISDNLDKGAGLVEKLQNEAELLWFSRKKLAEEKGRIAETKLTLPLMILLLVLVMITVAPAMMEM